MVKGYKVFHSDFTCRDFNYEVGKVFIHEGDLTICRSGFHFCEKLVDCFDYYSFDENNKICEVIAHGEVIIEGNKSVTNKLEIGKEITWNECLNLVNFGKNNTGDSNTGYCNTGDSNTGHSNTGHSNTGDSNTGNSNTGDRNTGYSNTGYSNTGDRNTGDLNKTDYSSGVFCTKEQKILIFDNTSEMTLSDWRNSNFAKLFYNFELSTWVYESDMSEQEKIDHPKFYVQEGFLKTFSPEDAWKIWFKSKSQDEIDLLKKIPNFDKEKFKYITGLDIE